MQDLVCFFIAIASTTVGALTGMGGGVIIKPVLDIFGHYNAATINILSSLTVLIMSVVSVGKMLAGRKASLDLAIAAPLAIGGLVGGNTGKWLLEMIFKATGAGNQAIAVQNTVLALLIIPVIIFMRRKDLMPRLDKRGKGPALAVGLLLGIFSAFLGIGGGPFNVVGIMMVLGMETKLAAVYSLFIILFSQAASAVLTAVQTGFSPFDLSMLPAMAVGAVAGGFLGAKLHSQLSGKRVETLFNLIQITVLVLCIVNIIRYR